MNWKKYTLGEICSNITSGGTPLRSNDRFYENGKIPWLKTKEVCNGRIYETENHITELGLMKSSAKLIPSNSVIVAMYGDGETAGRVAINKIPLATNQACCNLIFNSEKANYEYVYYHLLNSYDYLVNLKSGSGQQNLSATLIKNIEIELPNLPTQSCIASILSAFDDKIELNRRMNQTLEQMAQALFNHYFVDNIDPDNLPEGWERRLLKDFIKTTTGYSYKSTELTKSDCALVTLKNFHRNGGFRLDGFKEYIGNFKENQIVKEGDLAVAHTDVTQNADLIGNPILIINPYKYQRLVISTDLVKIDIINKRLSNQYLYYLMRDAEFKNHCLGYTNGTTVLHLSKSAVGNYKFNLPPIQIISKYNQEVLPIINRMNSNISENMLLEKTRDTLLPKLMSGEIDVDALMKDQTFSQTQSPINFETA